MPLAYSQIATVQENRSHADSQFIDAVERESRERLCEMQPLTSERNGVTSADPRRIARFSTVAMEMLKEREDCDLHPYGRGGRFEGFLYDARRVKVSLDHSKLITWILFFFGLLLVCGSIIYLAELDRKQNALNSSQSKNQTGFSPAARGRK